MILFYMKKEVSVRDTTSHPEVNSSVNNLLLSPSTYIPAREEDGAPRPLTPAAIRKVEKERGLQIDCPGQAKAAASRSGECSMKGGSMTVKVYMCICLCIFAYK